MSVLDLLNFIVVLVISTAMHELAHAGLADRFGDDTPRSHGRITFNPVAHLDPIMSVLVPAALYWMTKGNAFVAAAWTPVNPFRMRNPRVHGMLTALGGPLVNLGLAVLATAGFAAFVAASPEPGIRTWSFEGVVQWLMRGGRSGEPGLWICFLFLQVNVWMGVFNLLPLPPLDGGNLIQGLLPDRHQALFWNLRRYSMYFLLLLWVLGVLDATIFPAMTIAENLAGDVSMGLARAVRG